MKRTRKWSYVEQEAKRLADLGLAPVDIGKRLGVTRFTVQRWMAAGKLHDTRRGAPGQKLVTAGPAGDDWGKAIRSAYDLDADDQQLVKAGELALQVMHDPHRSVFERLSAISRFQSVVKQLNLVARTADEKKPAVDEPKPTPAEPTRRTGPDPRAKLMTVN